MKSSSACSSSPISSSLPPTSSTRSFPPVSTIDRGSPPPSLTLCPSQNFVSATTVAERILFMSKKIRFPRDPPPLYLQRPPLCLGFTAPKCFFLEGSSIVSPLRPDCHRFETSMSFRLFPGARYRRTHASMAISTGGTLMSSNSERLSPAPVAFSDLTGSKYTYSLRRWDAFEAWQMHVRKAADSVVSAFPPRSDRDLRRAVVPG